MDSWTIWNVPETVTISPSKIDRYSVIYTSFVLLLRHLPARREIKRNWDGVRDGDVANVLSENESCEKTVHVPVLAEREKRLRCSMVGTSLWLSSRESFRVIAWKISLSVGPKWCTCLKSTPGQAFPVFAIEKVALPYCRCLSFKTVKKQEGGKVSVSLTGISSCRDKRGRCYPRDQACDLSIMIW